ncbi:hypothetical protein AVEN_195672-1 [Araneus ventricosus]|uniref:Uncharacterized protein n=1 Tax=Araneus ventricosus TaxID=182803 RepID=A0A4Y2B8L2_ARAVE|nr:hypothetical protein AVEN_195672-1 [Araneus ventricosus]
MRHELDSSDLGDHLPHHPTPFYNHPLKRTEIGCVARKNWRSQNLPSKEAKRLRPAFVAGKGKFLDRLALCERVNKGVISPSSGG